LELFEIEPRRGLFGLGRGEVAVPRAARGRALLRLVDAGRRDVSDAAPLAGSAVPVDGPAHFVQVNMAPFEWSPFLPGFLRDAGGRAWDLRLAGRVWVEDPLRLALSGVPLPRKGQPVTFEALADWWLPLAASRLGDLLSSHPPEHWADPAAAPFPLWRDLVGGLGGPEGLGLELASPPSLHCAAKERAEEALASSNLARERERASLAAGQSRLNLEREMADLRQQAADLEAGQQQIAKSRAHDQSLGQIAMDGELAEALAASTLGKLELDRQIALKQRELDQGARGEELIKLAHQAELDNAARQREIAALQHEGEKARLLRELDGERARDEAARDRDREALRREQEALEADKKAFEAERARPAAPAANAPQLQALQALLEQIRAAAAPSQSQAAGWAATAAAIGLSPLALAELVPLGPAVFAETLLSWSAARPHRAALRLREPLTRDFAATDSPGSPGAWLPSGVPIPVKALKIGELLSFEITSTLGGHLTLINGGTSGRYWLMTPMEGRPPTLIQPGQAHHLPGPGFPPELVIQEQGPEGIEYMIAIVSPKPVATPGVLAQSISHAPRTHFRELPPAAMARLIQELQANPEDWACGVARFLVVSN